MLDGQDVERYLVIESGNKVWEDYPQILFFSSLEEAISFDYYDWTDGNGRGSSQYTI